MAPVVKLAAISAAMGMASFQIYAMSEDKIETVRLSPRELSINALDPTATHYMDEQPGDLQSGLGVVRVGLGPYVRAVKNAYTSVKVGAVTVYTAGHGEEWGCSVDISVGPRLMMLGVPLGMVTVGMAVCYPTQTVTVVKKQQAPPTSIPETEIPEAKPLPEAGSSEPVMPAVDEAPPSEPGSAPVPIEEGVPSKAEPAPQPTTEVDPAEGYN
uniref:MICOS complex subunit MIC27-like n=1 Tax=Oncorhynchus gorbuscha TaxID=8017 RepID=UPI001EAEEFC3|nr:MICOS complex subunit MIC27-like [Oncorhynchus gorbuscha]XP_046162563.1 MICOS complex subunit MIC27-like [Oncorhynchus gorbuscha]